MKSFLSAAVVLGVLLPNLAQAQPYPGYAAPYGTRETLQAQSSNIAGVWRAVQQSAYDPQTGIQSSAVYTTALKPDGTFETQIVVEGGNGTTGAGGVILISGQYQFDGQILQWRSENYAVCVVGRCLPQRPNDPNFGTVQQAEFVTDGTGRAVFLGLNWTRIA
jgi:hypothetical protein